VSRFKLVKPFALAICSALVLMASACHPSSPSSASPTFDASHPSDVEIRAAIENAINIQNGSADDVVKVVSFKKTDGQVGDAFGVQVYAVFYEATFECIDASGCVVASPSKLFDLVSSKRIGLGLAIAGHDPYKQFAKGSSFVAHGKVTLSKSEKGWH